MNPRYSLIVLLSLCPALSGGAATGASVEKAYMGVVPEISTNPPGLVLRVSVGGPADKGGLRTGDVLLALDGREFAGDPSTFASQLTEHLAGMKAGDDLLCRVYRTEQVNTLVIDDEVIETEFPVEEYEKSLVAAKPGGKIELKTEIRESTIDITIMLGPRPGSGSDVYPVSSELIPGFPNDPRGEMEFVDTFLDKLIDEADIRAECDDLQDRLNRVAGFKDGSRLKPVILLLRDGLGAEYLVREIGRSLTRGTVADQGEGLDGLLEQFEFLLRRPEPGGDVQKTFLPPVPEFSHFSGLINALEESMNESALHLSGAFGALTEEERTFVQEKRTGLTEIFRQANYIDSDEDQLRLRDNLKLIEIGKKLNYEELVNASRCLSWLTDHSMLEDIRLACEDEFADRLTEDRIFEQETPFGKIVVSGTGRSWNRGKAPAIFIDLGGNDFYTFTPPEGKPLEKPFQIVIDLGGDDAYESTTHYAQGSGSMGCGLLIDAQGDDSYIGLQWAQGTGFFGTGLLVDLSGDDTYRSHELSQGAGIFGYGALVDLKGNDTYEGHMKVQGFAGALSLGFLIDPSGDDKYYAKGTYPTGYGDPGVFDSWSQGCAEGFRQYASGGLAGLIDNGGSDRYEAGNFSQGGGYYYGMGFLHDAGIENDLYIGSRYNQGFCAHQAVGVFLEDGGNDFYTTRQAVAQGLAWDECVTVFIDYSGDDTYQGGGGFSQGASAHNAFCLFWDKGGKDIYEYRPGQARAGGNDYHGGTSLSLFIDEGGDLDVYDSDSSGNDKLTGWPEYGFFADLPGSVAQILADDAWKDLFESFEKKEMVEDGMKL